MKQLKHALLFVAGLTAMAAVPASMASADEPPAGRPGSHEPNWTYGIVRVGESRDAIKSMPITDRPYRPLHVYGNTVRRMHYRGTAVPAPRDIVGAGAATILRK